MRIAAGVMVVMAVAVTAARQPPAFDAVSIKRSDPSRQGSSIGVPTGAAFSMTNSPMLAVVTAAYPTQADVVGAPDWLRNDRYDVVAKAAVRPGRDDVQAMLRTMLKERLKLVAHMEPRDTPVYHLVVTRPGHPGLKRSTVDCDAIATQREAAAKTGAPLAIAPLGTAPPCDYNSNSRLAMFASGGITMNTFASWLTGGASRPAFADRPVLDRTGLEGRYEFTLRFTPPTAGAPANADDPPDLFAALQEQLGLRLEPTRALLDTLVIDHVERPAAN
jgi:uncharacterized protein (TIGR03435 family)